ncbi:acetolactate synthase, large subunit, biosynthetic type [Synechococcus sp. WH 8103]|nr:acetolactate synthase, large subunit, biosynthetic type [Synechococcus sp. WH 8103]
MRLSDYLVERFVEFGIKHAFLVTGGGAMHLNDALSLNPAINVTCFHHEQSCSIAAEGFYRASGDVPLVNVTSGPGGINAINGVFGAFTDSIPLIVISGQVKSSTLISQSDLPMRQLGDQEVDIINIVSPITKYHHILSDKNMIGAAIDKALFFAFSGRPGPVWIDIPIDLQAADVNPSKLERWDSTKFFSELSDPDTHPNVYMYPDRSSRLPHDCIKSIFDALNKSKRPVILAGSGIRISSTTKYFNKLIDHLCIPVVTGWNSHDLLPFDHKLFAGRPGTVGDRSGNFAVQNADFVLIIGCRLNIRQISYNWESFADKAFKVMVDVDKSELYKPTLSIDLPIHAPLEFFLPEFCEHLNHYCFPESHKLYLAWCKNNLLKYDPVVDAQYRDGFLNPYKFIEFFFQTIPKNSVVVSANGSACVIGFQSAKLLPGQRFFTNSGCASMGYDLPAAIGASLSSPELPTFCLAGDGSIMMNLQELSTISNLNLPIKIIMLDNYGYNSIRQTQSAYFPDNVFGTNPDNGLSFPSFEYLARAFKLDYLEITSWDDLCSSSFTDSILSDRPCFFRVVVDNQQPFAPKLASQKLDDGTMISPRLENMWPFLDHDELLQIQSSCPSQ